MTNVSLQTDQEIAPCLFEGPYADEARAFVASSRALGSAPYASVLRTWCVPYLFNMMEDCFAAESDPVDGIRSALNSLGDFLESASRAGLENIGIIAEPASANGGNGNGDVKTVTGEHYGNLFKGFSSRSFWDEPVELLRQRLERNGIAVSEIRNKKVLDAGCGGGRYSVAWRLLGARPVTGIDISPINVGDALRRVREAEINEIDFRKGNVLELPFGDDDFDIVFSNGVLHHTTNWKRGVDELVRVLKPGGMGWLYLIEKPGGVFWDMIEILRVVMKDEPKDTARSALQLLNIPANRIFYMLDHVMVPTNLRLTPDEIENQLSRSGAANIRRLTRGADFDRIEQIHQQKRFAVVNFGAGENRYIFSK